MTARYVWAFFPAAACIKGEPFSLGFVLFFIRGHSKKRQDVRCIPPKKKSRHQVKNIETRQRVTENYPTYLFIYIHLWGRCNGKREANSFQVSLRSIEDPLHSTEQLGKQIHTYSRKIPQKMSVVGGPRGGIISQHSAADVLERKRHVFGGKGGEAGEGG